MSVILPRQIRQAKESNQLNIVEIYDVQLRIGTLRLCNTNVDIFFEGHKYFSIPISREEVSQSVDETDNSVKFEMSDATMEQLKFIIEGFDFRGCIVRVRQILYPDSIDDNSIFRDVFLGYIDNPVYENGTMSFTLRSRIPKVTTPQRSYKSTCNSKFGDSICRMNLEITRGKVVSIFNNSLTLDIPNHAPDYWKDGVISIGGESRMIISSKDSSVSIYYPFFVQIQNGDDFVLKRGCDKLQSTCKNRFDNLIHFTGFPAIPFETVYR